MLPDISRSKGNQAMKFGQLIEHNMRNIFRLKSYTKYGGEIIPIIKHIVSVVCQVVDY